MLLTSVLPHETRKDRQKGPEGTAPSERNSPALSVGVLPGFAHRFPGNSPYSSMYSGDLKHTFALLTGTPQEKEVLQEVVWVTVP